jgi:thiol-disulfide isomerase/thioredoxin
VRPAIFPLLAALLASSLAACDTRRPSQPEQGAEAPAAPAAPADADSGTGRLDRLRAGTPAPRIAFEDGDGAPATIADFAGRPVLLNLWATWCGPCVAEMPTLDALAGQAGDRLAVLTVSQDLDGREKVDAFFRKYRFANLEAFLDPGMALMPALEIGTLPTTILYDSRGREVWRMMGMEEWNGPRAAALIAEAEGK